MLLSFLVPTYQQTTKEYTADTLNKVAPENSFEQHFRDNVAFIKLGSKAPKCV